MERVFDLFKVEFDHGAVRLCPRDTVSQAIAASWNGSLPPDALATKELPGLSFPVVLSRNCSRSCRAHWNEPVAFIRPYHWNNLYHLHVDNLLPLSATLYGYTNVTLVTWPVHHNFGKPALPHWRRALWLVGVRRLVRAAQLAGGSVCMRHAIWGLGVKPYWTPDRSRWHSALMFRQLHLASMPPGPGPAGAGLWVYIPRRKGHPRGVRNEEELIREVGLHPLDFAASFDSQLRLLRDGVAIVSAHGAGLTNMLYMREVNVVELRNGIGPAWMYPAMSASLGGTHATVPLDGGLKNIVNPTQRARVRQILINVTAAPQ